MPFIVCFYIAFTVQSFKKQAPLFLVSLLLFEGFSNFICLWYAYGLGTVSYTHIPFFKETITLDALDPLFSFPFTKPLWYSVDKASFLGVVMGLMTLIPSFKKIQQAIKTTKKIADFILMRIFSKLIPLFVVGFVANLYVSGSLKQLALSLSSLLPWLIGGLFVYIFLLYFIAAGGLKKAIVFIKNILPAGFLALTSGCSLSTMPWTIQGARKNLNDPDLANALIPATTNIQQIGDCIINAFLSYMIYVQFMGHPPSIDLWIPFCFVFTLARFTTAAVMGGAIFIMLPIYEKYLSFSPSMIALILAFNVLLDPIVTSHNVMANGALCSVFEKIWQRFTHLLNFNQIRQ